MGVWHAALEELVAAAGGGGAVALALRTGAKWVRLKLLANRIRREAGDGPEFGAPGWLWGQILTERGQRHAYEKIVNDLRERVARLEGRHESGEQARLPELESGRGSVPRQRAKSRPGG